MVLLTNDDGVAAPGLVALAWAAHRQGLEVTVVAPDRERSAAGHSMTVRQGLTIREHQGPYPPGMAVYSCSGTPTDCVILGLDEVAPGASWVISGVNRGPNLGDDVTYSGTVAAAMEGYLSDRRALAVSLCTSGEGAPHYDTAAAVALKVYCWAQGQNPVPLLNLNVPDQALSSLKGLKVVRQGRRRYLDRILRTPDGCYWIGGQIQDQLEPGTDVQALSQGYGAITPLHLDLTHFPSLPALAPLEELEL